MFGRKVILTAFIAALAGGSAFAQQRAPQASAAPQKATGKIKEFVCGDNCYLTIVAAKGKELTGLCTAKMCEPWIEEMAMPDELVGRTVEVTLGQGDQVDGSGKVMGKHMSFDVITERKAPAAKAKRR